MRVAYADPPYPGQSKRHYGDHPDYAGEVDHKELIDRMLSEYDGFCLHTSSVDLDYVLSLFPAQLKILGCRIMSWTKTFAAFKPNVPVAYAWEPIIVKACRKPVVTGRVIMRDWFACPITLKKGLCGVKPEPLCRWLFEVMGMESEDELDDLFIGSGAVTQAWETWKSELVLFTEGKK